MPPVFGPASPSPTRLKSCAGASGTPRRRRRTARAATARARSGPPRSPACGPRRRTPRPRGTPRTASRGVGERLGDEHALARRQPVGLDDVEAGQRLEERERGVLVARRRTRAWRAVGTPASASTLLHPRLRALERAPRAAGGPNTSAPARRAAASASPSTSGASGPTTTSSASTSSRARDRGGPTRRRHASPSSAIPGLPGAATTVVDVGERARPTASACSRPPPPTTRTVHRYATREAARRLVAGRADRHEAHVDAGELLDELHVVARRRRQVLERSARSMSACQPGSVS